MHTNAGFWVGMGAGVAAGAVLGMMTASNRHSMKPQVGKSLHKLGVAMDEAVHSIVSELH